MMRYHSRRALVLLSTLLWVGLVSSWSSPNPVRAQAPKSEPAAAAPHPRQPAAACPCSRPDQAGRRPRGHRQLHGSRHVGRPDPRQRQGDPGNTDQGRRPAEDQRQHDLGPDRRLPRHVHAGRLRPGRDRD